MKKLMLMSMVVMLAVAVMAVGKPVWEGVYYPEYNRLVLEKNYVAARAYVDEFDWTLNDGTKNGYVTYVMRLDVAERKAPKDLSGIQAWIGAMSVKVSFTNKDTIDYLVLGQAYNLIENKQVSYDFYKSIANPTDNIKASGANCCLALKKYDEALEIHIQLGNYALASNVTATYLKDKAKTFEYCSKAMLDQYCTPAVLQQLLDRVGGFSYIGTSVTKQMQIDLLTELDNKYSRFLVKETNMEAKDKVWTPIITGIRLQKEKLLEPTTVVK